MRWVPPASHRLRIRWHISGSSTCIAAEKRLICTAQHEPIETISQNLSLITSDIISNMPSFWEKYLAPGDVRATPQPETTPSDATQDANESQQPEPRIDPAHRARRQNALLFGGMAFTVLSAIVTRRALARKRIAIPSSFTPSNATPPKVDGGMEAVEALGIATLNVFSVAMLASGALMKAYDVADLEDMRDAVRAGVGYDVYGGDSKADKELEAWVADVLSRKDGMGDLKSGIAEKLLELEQRESSKQALAERRKGS
ncbi:Hypothetical protein R9X50_00368300 [Acrodontium crateriforme]|uniref:Altered inheritance of mitochondria protein 11 n=1 Tax=Acrodontium crateriforme TaxID=150365 RepID=A0AAQ3RC26_9PEZI|nr:Hypothetical protein R9X50_00368300 [Acrodontium crateriforme]